MTFSSVAVQHSISHLPYENDELDTGMLVHMGWVGTMFDGQIEVKNFRS